MIKILFCRIFERIMHIEAENIWNDGG